MYYHVPGYGFVQTKGHSILKQRSYSPAFHRRPTAFFDDVYEPLPYSYIPKKHYIAVPYDPNTGSEETFLRSEVNRELFLTAAAMEDNYDLAQNSRKRDDEVLSKLNKEIPPSTSEPTTTPASQYTASGVSSSLRRFPTRSLPSRPASSFPSQTRALSETFRAHPSYRTTTTLTPIDLAQADSDASMPFMNIAKKLENIRSLREGTYQPTYATTNLAHGYIPPRLVSPYTSPVISPIGSGTQTPVEYDYETPDFDGREVSPYYRKRRKPKVLGMRRHIGTYYDRLLQKRAAKGSASSKYWPYIDVDDIETESVDDLVDTTEHSYDADIYSGDNSGHSYIIKTGATPDECGYDYEYDDDDYVSSSNIPNRTLEYIPFKPRKRYTPDVDGDITDFKSTLPLVPDLAVTPYIPQRSAAEAGTSSIADDLKFNSIVAAAAARARRALHNVDFDQYDQASLVLSVEGEYTGPKSEVPVGFRYISRPIPLKVPASVGVSAYDSDSSFTKYLTNMQNFRSGIRQRLDDGYRALTTCVPHTPPLDRYKVLTTRIAQTPVRALPSSSTSYDSSNASASALTTPYSYIKRLRPEDGFKYGHSIETYPLATREGTPASSLPSSSVALPERLSMKLFDSESDSPSKVSTLDRIMIKAASETHTSPRSAVASTRANRPHVQPIIVAPVVYSSPPSRPTASRSRKEAALVGSKVEVVRPAKKHSRHPRSKYAQAKLRSMRKDDRGVAEIHPEVTLGLKASRPASEYPHKAIRNVEGFTKPKNILSWQYRLQARISPDALLYQPRAFVSMRDQVREVKDKMDRQRQLLDRYLPGDMDEEVKGKNLSKLTDQRDDSGLHRPRRIGTGIPSTTITGSTNYSPAAPTADVQQQYHYHAPMSPLRRQIRRVVARSHGDPQYYRHND